VTTDIGRRSVAGNAAVMMTSQAITWAFAFAMAIVLPRYLGPAALGQLRLGVSLWAVAGVVVAFGTETLLTKEFSRDPARASSLVGGAATVQLLAFGASCVGVAAFVVLAGYDRQVAMIVAIIGVSIAFQPFVTNARAVLFGLERMERVAVVDVLSKVVYLLMVLLLIAVGADVLGIAAASVAPAATAAVAMTWVLRRFGIPARPRLRGLSRVARDGRQYLAIGFTVVAYQQIDIVVISLLVAEETLGWYSTADTLFSSLLFVPTILMTSLFPAMARLHAEDTVEAGRMVRRAAGLLLLAGVPIGLGTVAVATPLSVLLFGPAFTQTGPVLAVLGIVLLLTYMTILLGRYAIAVDRQRFWLRLMAVAVVATIALDVVLVPWADRVFDNGAIGGAIAYVLTESMMLAVGVWKLAPHLADRAVLQRAGRCLIAGAAMLAAVWPLRWTFIALPIGVGATVYVGMVLTLRIPDDEERAAVRSVVERAMAKVGHTLTRQKVHK
jgi:O-antigen/teichoic acid export membrane protein